MKSLLKKLLKYIIPQRIALQIGSWKTYIIGEDGDVKDLESSVIVEEKFGKTWLLALILYALTEVWLIGIKSGP